MTSRVLCPKQRPGFLLVEVLLGIAIFSIFLAGLGMTLIYGQENTINAGDRTRGAYLTERTMEAIRSIRDSAFSSVTTGTKGVWVSRSTNQWAFSGSQVTLSGSYVVNVSVSSKASDWMAFTGTTTWKHGYNRAGTVKLVGEVTDWKTPKTVGNWATPSVEGTLTPGGSPQFNEVAVAGTTAYVTCAASAGLYIIDITSTTAPARLNSSFSIGYGATGVAVRGKRLYVLTADPNAELKVYNITTASTPTLITSYNLPGSALGTSLTIGYNNMYVGATYSAIVGQSELYSFDISNSGSVVLKSALDDTDSVNGMALTGTSAYLASSVDTSELRVVNAVASGSLTLIGGYNLTDRTLNGTKIAVSGTSAVLGTQASASIQEMVLFSLGSSGGIPSGSGPWYHDASGSVMGLSMDPYRCYTFIAASTGKKAFQVVDMRNKASLPELYSYNSTSGLARGLGYDLVRDRVYLLTDSAFLIFKPAVSSGTCP
jgi:Tfp pilus assembly protein PilV